MFISLVSGSPASYQRGKNPASRFAYRHTMRLRSSKTRSTRRAPSNGRGKSSSWKSSMTRRMRLLSSLKKCAGGSATTSASGYSERRGQTESATRRGVRPSFRCLRAPLFCCLRASDLALIVGFHPVPFSSTRLQPQEAHNRFRSAVRFGTAQVDRPHLRKYERIKNGCPRHCHQSS